MHDGFIVRRRGRKRQQEKGQDGRVFHKRAGARFTDGVSRGGGKSCGETPAGSCAGLETLRESPASGPGDLSLSPRARAIVGVTPLAEAGVDVENELTPVFDVKAGEEPA